ncbi:MAG: hypothetical protein ACI9XO_000484 [Paraglaciecola sp.]|jgi:hypothetical protein
MGKSSLKAVKQAKYKNSALKEGIGAENLLMPLFIKSDFYFGCKIAQICLFFYTSPFFFVTGLIYKYLI